MATPDFYDENLNRTFPFRRASAGVGTPDTGAFTLRQLPDWAVVDCGFVIGPESGFVEGVHSVYLYRVENMGGAETTIEFEFRCDAPEVAGDPLIFSREAADPKYALEFVESDYAEIDYSSVSYSFIEGECGEPFWSGYLVTGNLAPLAARLTVGVPVVRVDPVETIVEPGLIQNLDRSQVISFNVANADRTRALRPVGCDPNVWPFPIDEIYLNRTCLQGDIQFRAGYNMAISLVASQNVIRFSAVQGAGQGEPCEQIPLFIGESPPTGASNDLLGGDFYCNEVFRTLNGLAGPDIRIQSGPGINISTDTATVIFDVNLNNLRDCNFESVSLSEE